MKAKKKISRKKANTLYSKGQLNYLIDATIHPLTDKNTSFVLVDELLHILVEKNPSISLTKFVRYNLPQIIRKVAKDRRRGFGGLNK
jgi:Asp-tRNA(Asn)/Glu-tRNA(Gln) amidotransferase B subunit